MEQSVLMNGPLIILGNASLVFPIYEENGRIILDTSTLAHIRAIEKISKDNPHAVLFLDFSSSDKGFDCGFDIYKSGYYLKKESIKIMVKKP